MYDHFKPPEHFTFWRALAYRLSGAAIVIGGLVLIAVYAMPWLDARYFAPFSEWFTPRFFSLFGGYDTVAVIVFFAVIFAPWAGMHVWLSYDARKKRNREKASADTPQ
jgi:multisubunit Na+/H+ antiporter MnhB subunit